jgi:hypothetical protein
VLPHEFYYLVLIPNTLYVFLHSSVITYMGETYFYVGFVCKKHYVVSVSNEIYFLKALVLMFVC